jgi:hydrogenase/urease accessory protein HupE
MNLPTAIPGWLAPEHVVMLALAIVLIELVLRLLLALRGRARPGWQTGLWNSVAGAGLLLALAEAMGQQRPGHLIAALALAGLAHGLALRPLAAARGAKESATHPAG